jgi:hypothetical protein
MVKVILASEQGEGKKGRKSHPVNSVCALLLVCLFSLSRWPGQSEQIKSGAKET